ncbi:NAD(+) diphosphatase [Nocardioides donggukensis]|uniref:NAD(+) diphosphatase n=1 Tax=Nocardioides donggukensis TaxID=2774019 RepID=A0A927K5K6_9ACTN|nr:NAD(+) diphosphatase [Nocardioides donggukensis]MBD8870228.1 NAD(+) diphosphatase [Nocardioides donggukensis]
MSFPHLDLAADAHDRAGVRRVDAAWLEERWADPDTRVLVVAGTRIRPVGGRVDWRPSAQVPDGTRLLLGERDGRTWFAVIVDPDQAPGERGEWVGLRAVLPRLAAADPEGSSQAPLLFHAIGLAEWHWATRRCPRCGAPVVARSAGHELVCTECGKGQFPRTDPAVIMAITHGDGDDEAILLGRHPSWPAGRYSTLAGFLEPGETLEDAVRREVAEEVGVVVGDVHYFGSQPWPLPASLMVGFVGRALSREIHVDGHEIESARWFTRAELRAAWADGSVVVPTGISISSSLLEHWFGEPLPGDGW